MKYFFIIVFLIINLNISYGSNNDCLKKVKEILQTKSELYLFDNQEIVQDYFDLKCQDTDFGNTLYSQDAFVFIHEAAHFEDLGFGKNGPSQGDHAKNLNLYTINDEHIGNFSSYQNLPKVKDVIRPYLKKEKPELLKKDSIYMSMHHGYIGAEDSMAAEVIQGMATELNGYTHGAIVQSRVIPLLPNPVIISDDNGVEYTVPNPYSTLPSQLDGVMYFIYNFNLYMNILKKDYPDKWKSFDSAHNKEYLGKLLGSSLQSLESLDHCNLKDSYENINFYITELLKDDLSILKDILGETKVNSLTCLNSTVEKFFEILKTDITNSNINNSCK